MPFASASLYDALSVHRSTRSNAVINVVAANWAIRSRIARRETSRRCGTWRMPSRKSNSGTPLGLQRSWCRYTDEWHILEDLSYGRIPNISGKGFCAQYMLEMLQKSRMILDNKVQNLALKSTTRLLLMPQYSATSTSTSSTSSASLPATSAAGEVAEPQIGHLIVIDRASDLLTPLCTQLTYEGLIDEAFNINHSTLGHHRCVSPRPLSDAWSATFLQCSSR